MLKRTFLFIFCSVFLICSACTKTGDSALSAVQNSFDTFTDSVFCDTVTANTINLHYTLAYPEKYGIKNAKTTLGDYGYDYFLKECDNIELTLKKLKEFPYEQLTESQQLTYDILLNALAAEAEAKDYILFSEAFSPLTGYHSQLPILMANYTFRNDRDIENYLLLLAEFDEYFAKLMEFQVMKSENGYFMPDFMAQDVIEQCQTFIDDIDNNYLIETFNTALDELDWLSAEKKAVYIEKNLEYIKNDVVNAYTLVIDGLTDLIDTGTNTAGLCYYDTGRQYYAYLVKNATGSSKSVRTLQQMTEEYIKNSLQEIYSLMIIDPALVDNLDTFSFSVSEPSEILEHLKENIKTDFPALPDTVCEIHSVHTSLEESLSPAFFLVPPLDDTYNNVIYINNYYKNRNLFTTLAHEGYPGHLYQNVYTASQKLPLIRSVLSFPGYTEGWATYVEYYSYNLDSLDANLAHTLALNDSSTLGLYAYLDMGIHYDGWLYEDVLEYLNIFGFRDEEAIREIYETIVENPAEYLSYFIGYLEILELREMAQAALKDDFSMKDFHTFLLKIGPAPYNIISEYMNKYWLCK